MDRGDPNGEGSSKTSVPVFPLERILEKPERKTDEGTGRMKETKETKEEQRLLLSKASLNSKKGVCQKDNLLEKEQSLPVPLPVNFQPGCEVPLQDLHLDAKVKTRSSLRWDQWTRRQLLGRGASP